MVSKEGDLTKEEVEAICERSSMLEVERRAQPSKPITNTFIARRIL
jgi:hypothetical protein